MRLSFGEDILVMDSSGTEKTVITSTGGLSVGNITSTGTLTINGANDRFVETLSYSSGSISPSSMTAYGVSVINMTGTDPSTSPTLATLGVPIPGVRKTILFNSTAAYINTIDVDLGAGVGVSGSTTNRFLAFSTLATTPQVINLIGLTTALWGVTSIDSTVAGGFGAPTGIRAVTAARTS